MHGLAHTLRKVCVLGDLVKRKMAVEVGVAPTPEGFKGPCTAVMLLGIEDGRAVGNCTLLAGLKDQCFAL